MSKAAVVHFYVPGAATTASASGVVHQGSRTPGIADCGAPDPNPPPGSPELTCPACRLLRFDPRCHRPDADALNAALDRYARAVRRCTEARMLLAQIEGSLKRERRLEREEERCQKARGAVVGLVGGGQDG